MICVACMALSFVASLFKDGSLLKGMRSIPPTPDLVLEGGGQLENTEMEYLGSYFEAESLEEQRNISAAADSPSGGAGQALEVVPAIQPVAAERALPKGVIFVPAD